MMIKQSVCSLSRTELLSQTLTQPPFTQETLIFCFPCRQKIWAYHLLTICPWRSMSPKSADLPTQKFGELVTSVTISLLMLQKPSSVPLFCQNLTTASLFYHVLQNILTNYERSKIRQPDLSSKLASTNTSNPSFRNFTGYQ